MIAKLKMRLMWITFEISNEVIGFARDKTIILAKNREMRGNYPHFHKDWEA